MRKGTFRIISFKQTPESEEYIYALEENVDPVLNDVYYNRNLGKFACLQRILHPHQIEQVKDGKYPLIRATNDPKFITLPTIPQTVVEQYFQGGKQLKEIELRLP